MSSIRLGTGAFRRAARMRAVIFGQHQTRGVHVRAGDMRMDVDAAGHRNEPACVHRFVRLSALRRRDDCIVADPEIADFVALVGGVDDMRAFDMDQHEAACACLRPAAMRSIASATLGVAVRADAVSATRVPMSDECVTAS
jgi:hypothetical protein